MSTYVTYAKFNFVVPSKPQLPKTPIPTLMAETWKNTATTKKNDTWAYRPNVY